MTTQVRLDQWILDIEYSYESGDEYHCLDWIDLSVLSGTICLEDETCVDMSGDEVHSVWNRFADEIERKLIEDINGDEYE